MSEPKVNRSGGQAYLWGPMLHLRAVEREDAVSEPSWRDRWFPRALGVSEACIEDELSSEALLVAVRSCDGVILGSVTIETEGAWRQVRPFVARWLDRTDADAVEAEIIELILPFLVDEGGAITVLVEIASGKPLVEAALTRIGARRCYRHREAWQLDGAPRDKLGYQLFNRRAVETFGEPEIVAEDRAALVAKVPAPSCWPRIETPPAGVVMAGERLYLPGHSSRKTASLPAMPCCKRPSLRTSPGFQSAPSRYGALCGGRRKRCRQPT